MQLNVASLICLLISIQSRLVASSPQLEARGQIHTVSNQKCYTHVADTPCKSLSTVTKTVARETDQCSAVVTYTPTNTVGPKETTSKGPIILAMLAIYLPERQRSSPKL